MAAIAYEGARRMPLLEQIRLVDRSNNPSPLFLAIARNDKPLVHRLIADGADVNCRNSNGRTPLHVAATGYKHPDIILALLKAGADVNAVDVKHKTPLIDAMMLRNKNLVELLLDNGARADIGDCNGIVAIEKAIYANYVDLFPKFLRAVDSVNFECCTERHFLHITWTTLLHIAHRNRRWEIMRMLLEAGSHIDARDYADVSVHDLLVERREHVEMGVSAVLPLTCQCARAIAVNGLSTEKLPPSMRAFVCQHRRTGVFTPEFIDSMNDQLLAWDFALMDVA